MANKRMITDRKLRRFALHLCASGHAKRKAALSLKSQMTIPLLSLVPLLMTLVVDVCAADTIALGYVSGTDYQTLSEAEKEIWFIGVMDGIMAESISAQRTFVDRNNQFKQDADMEYATWLGRCIEKYETTQLRAIFEKLLSNEPESWHAPAALHARQSLQEFCYPSESRNEMNESLSQRPPRRLTKRLTGTRYSSLAGIGYAFSFPASPL